MKALASEITCFFMHNSILQLVKSHADTHQSTSLGIFYASLEQKVRLVLTNVAQYLYSILLIQYNIAALDYS